MRRRSRKPKYQLKQQPRIHDRTSAIVPHGAKIFVDTTDDPWPGVREFASDEQTPGELRAAPPPRISVVRSIRADPLGALKAQGVIDEVQFLAGQIWQWSYMRAEIGALKAIDPTLESVDGSHLSDPLNQQVRKAVANLRKAKAALGSHGERLVIEILGKGRTLSQTADNFGLPSRSGREYIGRRFRECLDCLAVVFGCATGRNTA